MCSANYEYSGLLDQSDSIPSMMLAIELAILCPQPIGSVIRFPDKPVVQSESAKPIESVAAANQSTAISEQAAEKTAPFREEDEETESSIAEEVSDWSILRRQLNYRARIVPMFFSEFLYFPIFL